MKQLFINLGRIRAVIAITVVSELLVLIVTVVIELFLSPIRMVRGILVATCVTLIVAPIMGWFFVDILMRVRQLEEEMRALATYDELTGLLRRRAFLEQSDYFRKVAARNGADFCVIIVDLDTLKKVNDQYGHAAGDNLLVSFSKAVKTNIREGDLVSRFGGDEFVFYLPDTTLEQALKFTERLHVSLREANQSNGLPIDTTVSIGLVTNAEVKTENVEDFINAADKALYRAKDNGGNQTQIYSKAVDKEEWLTPQSN